MSLKKNFSYMLSYKLFAFLVPIVTAPYLSRVLGAVGLGDFAYYNSVAIYFVMIAKLGMENYGAREISLCGDDTEARNRVFSELFMIQFLCTAAVSIAYLSYSLFLPGDTTVKLVFMLYVASTFADIDWLFYGIKELREIVIRNLIVKILTVVLIYLLVKDKSDFLIYTVIMCSGLAFGYLSVLFCSLRYIQFTKISRHNLTRHLKYTLLLSIPIISMSLYRQCGRIMLKTMIGSEVTGFYDNAEKIIQMALTLVSSFSTVLMPYMVKSAMDNGTRSIVGSVNKYTKILSFFTCGMTFGLLGIAGLFCPVFFGPQFFPSTPILQGLSITIIIIGITNTIRMLYIIPTGRDSIYIVSTVIGFILNLTVNFFLIPIFGANGAVVGTLTAELSVLFYQWLRCRSVIQYTVVIKNHVPFIASGFLSLGLGKIIIQYLKTDILSLFVLTFIIGITYVTVSLVWLFLGDKAFRTTIVTKILPRLTHKSAKNQNDR